MIYSDVPIRLHLAIMASTNPRASENEAIYLENADGAREGHCDGFVGTYVACRPHHASVEAVSFTRDLSGGTFSLPFPSDIQYKEVVALRSSHPRLPAGGSSRSILSGDAKADGLGNSSQDVLHQ